MKINIAIDGPSAAGKSSVADALAEKLDYVHLDTGSMYRACAYLANKYKLELDNEEEITALLLKLPMQAYADGSVYVDGEHLKQQLFGNEISMAASTVSKLHGVREAMVAKQQEITAEKGYIVDGRDICSVVLPDAELKIYLTASAEARAKRRTKQNIEKGVEADYDKILADIIARDYQDMHREFSPLVQAEDAILIDSSDLTLEEVINKVYELAIEKIEEND